MDAVLVDNLVVFFALVYYALLFVVYLLRAQELTKLEWKPYHHPDRWPVSLVVYLLLLFIGSIGLNWYGYLMSPFYGNMLVIAFFIMMSSYGHYQYTYNKRRKVNNSQKQ
jgi:hypothetical protein